MPKRAIAFKDSVDTFTSLPTSGNALGDVRIIRDNGIEYYWSINAAAGALADWKILNDPIPSAINNREKLNLELEMEYKAASKTYYKEFSYVGSNLTGVIIYEDNSKAVQLFTKVLTYVGKNLTQTVLTRVSDGVTLTKAFTYVGKNLTSVDIT